MSGETRLMRGATPIPKRSPRSDGNKRKGSLSFLISLVRHYQTDFIVGLLLFINDLFCIDCFSWYLLIYSQRSAIDTKGWDVFRVLPPEDTTGSLANQKVVELTVKIFKVVAYLLTFVIVLSAGVISKGTVLFMTSQLKPGKTTEYCTRRKSSSVSLWPFGFGHTSS